jgi:hypothetical protein
MSSYPSHSMRMPRGHFVAFADTPSYQRCTGAIAKNRLRLCGKIKPQAHIRQALPAI